MDRLTEEGIVLRDLEGLEAAEIARVVGAPLLLVRTRLFYARREIEEMLPDEPALAAVSLSFCALAGAPLAH